MTDLQKKFLAHWQDRRFARPGQVVILALSGGIDSMVLAHLLHSSGIPFAVAHCNFALRGADSDTDESFVQNWCAARGIVCHTRVFDTAGIAVERRESIQVTARNLRYGWFSELIDVQGYTAVLTAHHKDDVAETVLINLGRGTGIAGLHGIPERTGHVFRPLLFASRKEIADFAEQEEVVWREDASNTKTDYLRNALRHRVLPVLEEILPGAALRIADTAARIGEAEEIYRQVVEKRLSKLLQQRGKDWYIPIRLFRKMDQARTIAFELFSRFGYTPDQIPGILALMDSDSGKRVSSSDYRVIRHREFLVITANADESAELILIDHIPQTVITDKGSYDFSWVSPDEPVSSDSCVACLHADDIVLPVVLRTRREGDYFYPLGMGGKKKKLKRFLIDTKVPVHEKAGIRILEWDRKILWIGGLRIDDRFKIRPATRRILKVVFTRPED